MTERVTVSDVLVGLTVVLAYGALGPAVEALVDLWGALSAWAAG